MRTKPIPRWAFHAVGVMNAWFMLANLYKGWHSQDKGWYLFAAVSFVGILITARSLKISEKQ